VIKIAMLVLFWFINISAFSSAHAAYRSEPASRKNSAALLKAAVMKHYGVEPTCVSSAGWASCHFDEPVQSIPNVYAFDCIYESSWGCPITCNQKTPEGNGTISWLGQSHLTYISTSGHECEEKN
jgi:hypothetical protein